MALDILIGLIGITLATVTLRDVFDTVVVPGTSHTSLRIARRVVLFYLPLWKAVRGRRHALSGNFAPIVLVTSFAIWMGLLTVGFGFVAYALRGSFSPPLQDLGQSIYVAGGAIATIGAGQADPRGAAGGLLVLAGFCGLGVMTMAVTYLLEVQSSVGERDTGIMKLNTSAGDPPSALALLERFSAIRNTREIAATLREARDWCAVVRQSHGAHPSLIYFRTSRTGAGWPAALGAMIDLALIAEHLIADEDLYGPAILLRDDGIKMGADLADMLKLGRAPDAADDAEVKEVARRLRNAGYPLRESPDFADISGRRSRAQSAVAAMARHLGQPSTVLVPR